MVIRIPTTPDEFFTDKALSKKLFQAVRTEVDAIGEASIRVTKSQIAFRRRRNFAWVWMPEQYLKRPAAPLVLTLALPWRDGSPRWKQIVEPVPGRFTHHLELNNTEDIDEEVRGWLRRAWEAAASPLLPGTGVSPVQNWSTWRANIEHSPRSPLLR